MRQPKRRQDRTRADIHRVFERRAKNAFRFLIDEFGFQLVKRAEGSSRNLDKEVTIGYFKEPDVSIGIHCTGIFQHVFLQSRTIGVRTGLHRLMRIRCPHLEVPPSPDDEVESDLREQLEFCAQVLRDHFRDFLDGDPSVLDEPLPTTKKKKKK